MLLSQSLRPSHPNLYARTVTTTTTFFPLIQRNSRNKLNHPIPIPPATPYPSPTNTPKIRLLTTIKKRGSVCLHPKHFLQTPKPHFPNIQTAATIPKHQHTSALHSSPSHRQGTTNPRITHKATMVHQENTAPKNPDWNRMVSFRYHPLTYSIQ